jgi:hypothetical protein
MKKNLLKGLGYLALGYVLLVILYFIHLAIGGSQHEAALNEPYAERAMQMEMPVASFSKSAANYATFNFRSGPSQATVEQKYEKIGSIESSTDKFTESENQAREIVKQNNALIQGEAVNSSDKLRGLHLTIGVPPENFDAIVTALKDVGRLLSFNVTKTDKTNDFLELKAKRTTLEKTRDALIGLKTQGGKIDELIKLEQEILKLEGDIQGLGVQLGQFDKVNEFCTVRFNLSETVTPTYHSPYMGYLLSSLQWAASIYLTWLGILCVGLVAVILLLILVDKSKIFRTD